MTVIIDGTAGITFPVTAGSASAVQASSGRVLQVVSSITSTSTSTTSATPVTTGLTASITPSSASSKVLVQVVGGTCDNVGSTGQQTLLTIYRNSTNLFGSNGTNLTFSTLARIMAPASAGILDSPATTSATTYTLYIASANTAGTVSLIASNSVVTMILMEIAA